MGRRGDDPPDTDIKPSARRAVSEISLCLADAASTPGTLWCSDQGVLGSGAGHPVANVG